MRVKGSQDLVTFWLQSGYKHRRLQETQEKNTVTSPKNEATTLVQKKSCLQVARALVRGRMFEKRFLAGI